MSRIKLINRLIKAQDATVAPSDGQGAQTGSTQSTIPGSPRTVSVDSYFPTFGTAWGANFKAPVDELLSVLGWAVFTLSVGQMDLEQLREVHFVVDTSKYPDPFLMGVVMFSRSVYATLLNNGQPFTTKVQNKKEIIDGLLTQIGANTKIPDSLGPAFPQSFLLSKTGNIKPRIISILTKMKSLL